MPYVDPRRLDVWTDLSNMIPTKSGTYRTPKICTDSSITGAATPGTLVKAKEFPNLAGSSVVTYLGTSTKIFELSSIFAATDRSGTSGGALDFARIGNVTVASTNGNGLYSRTDGGGNFATIASSPATAQILVTQSNVVLAFNLGSGSEHCWATSDVVDYTNWTTGESVASTPIFDTPGGITAAVAFKDIVLVFKANAVYQMRYVGSPVYWTVQRLADNMGALGMSSVCVAGDQVVFVGNNGSFIYDGGSFRPTSGNQTRHVFLWQVGSNQSEPVFFPGSGNCYFPTDGGGAVGLYVYNVFSDAWGPMTLYDRTGVAVSVARLICCRPTGNELDGTQSSSLRAVETDLSEIHAMGVEWNLENLSGADPAVTAYVQTGIYGQGEKLDTYFDGAMPLLVNTTSNGETFPAATSMTLDVTTYTNSDKSGSVAAVGSPFISSTAQKRFDFRATAKWLLAKLSNSTAHWEIDDIHIPMKPAGKT
jgi:hypothetical protein